MPKIPVVVEQPAQNREDELVIAEVHEAANVLTEGIVDIKVDPLLFSVIYRQILWIVYESTGIKNPRKDVGRPLILDALKKVRTQSPPLSTPEHSSNLYSLKVDRASLGTFFDGESAKDSTFKLTPAEKAALTSVWRGDCNVYQMQNAINALKAMRDREEYKGASDEMKSVYMHTVARLASFEGEKIIESKGLRVLCARSVQLHLTVRQELRFPPKAIYARAAMQVIATIDDRTTKLDKDVLEKSYSLSDRATIWLQQVASSIKSLFSSLSNPFWCKNKDVDHDNNKGSELVAKSPASDSPGIGSGC